MTIQHSLSDITKATRDFFQPVINVEHRLADGCRSIFHEACEFERDVETAIRNPNAMTTCERRTDEMKLLIGSLCALEGGFFPTIGGVAVAVEALYHLENAGHQYRLKHPGPLAPASNSPRP